MTPRGRLALTLALLGVVAVLAGAGYVAYATAPALRDAGVPESQIPLALAASLAQGALLVSLAAWGGAHAAPRAGLDAPALRAALEGRPWRGALRTGLLPALAWGSAAGLLVLALVRVVFASVVASAPPTGTIPLWARALAPIYGGVAEELLVRWAMLSLLMWALLRLGRGPAFWIANVGAALAFGALHLPFASTVYGALTPSVVAFVLVGNGAAGLVFGHVFRRHGLEAAMVAHAVADVWLHVLPALVA